MVTGAGYFHQPRFTAQFYLMPVFVFLIGPLLRAVPGEGPDGGFPTTVVVFAPVRSRIQGYVVVNFSIGLTCSWDYILLKE